MSAVNSTVTKLTNKRSLSLDESEIKMGHFYFFTSNNLLTVKGSHKYLDLSDKRNRQILKCMGVYNDLADSEQYDMKLIASNAEDMRKFLEFAYELKDAMHDDIVFKIFCKFSTVLLALENDE